MLLALLLTSCWGLPNLLALRTGLTGSKGIIIAKPDYSVYHHKEELLQEVQRVVDKSERLMTMETINREDGGYKVKMQVVTVETAGLSKDHSKKARILMDFGEHGREFISSELGLRLLETLADPKKIRDVLGDEARSARLLQLLDRVVLKIIPMENVNGRGLVELGNLCERKNGRGVDTNRNYAVDWGKKEKDYSAAEEYPGTKPFSEPEVQVVIDVARQLQPHVWINVHSGMEAMFTPWDHCGQVPEGAQEALQLLRKIKEEELTKDCVVGSGGKSVGYYAHGTATDYMFQELKVAVPTTWEIFGDLKAHSNDCFRMFNPLTREHTEETLRRWLRAFFKLVELLPSHSAVADIFSSPLGGAEPAPEVQEGQGTQAQTQGGPQEQEQHQKQQLDNGPQADDAAHPTTTKSRILRNAALGLLSFLVVAFVVHRFYKQAAAAPGNDKWAAKDAARAWA